MSNQNTKTTCGACTVAIGAHTRDDNCKLGPQQDYTQAEYEQALTANGFTRDNTLPGHVRTLGISSRQVGNNSYQICEAAIQDMFETRREMLAELIATRDWENAQ